ncbi:MAG: hypothetical protein AB1426_11015 [Bacillota bacterium]
MRMRNKIMLGIVGIVVALAIAVPVQAGGINYARAWETLGGSRWKDWKLR